MLPELIVIGAMKGGTRSLYEYLGAHPDVFMSTPKELDFFSHDDRWGLGRTWYEGHFSGVDAEQAAIRGEASTSYTKHPRHPAVVDRMAAVVPGVRLVYLVRHPVDRIESHYRHLARKGEVRRPIDEEVLADPEYVAVSSYAAQIERYLDHFPREALLVVPTELLRSDRAGTMARIYEFVGVDPDKVPGDALAAEFSRAADRRVARRGTRTLRRVPGVRRTLDAIPASARARLSGLGSIPSDASRLRLAEPTRDTLAERLAPDLARLRPHLPEDFDGWGLI